MKQAQKKFALVAATFAFGLAGCGVWGASNAGSSGVAAAVPLAVDALPATQISGMYEGRISDHMSGKGVLVIRLAPSNTGGYGGSFATTYGKMKGNAVIALSSAPVVAVSSALVSLRGNAVALLNPPCSFTLEAKYDPKTHNLRGSYGATYRCSGDRGSFVAAQQCYYVTGPVPSAIQRPNAGGIKPC
jgi:hypothetical protein